MLSSSAAGMFSSYHPTGPGSSWDTTAEGSQNFQEFSDQGDYYHAGSEDYMSCGRDTPRMDHLSNRNHNRRKAAAAADTKAPKAESMRRIASRDSAGSHKHRTTKASSSKKNRPRVRSSLSDGSSHYSGLDVTGNVSGYTADALDSAQIMDPQQYLAQDLDSLSVSSHMSSQGLISGLMGLTADGLVYPATMEYAMSQHVDPSATQIFDPHMTGNSPHSWESLSSLSRISSPGPLDDAWSAAPLVASPADTHGSSPDFAGHSPSLNRAFDSLGPQDLNGSVMTAICDDDFTLPSSFPSTRHNGEGEYARDHYLYKNAFPQADGLFHCPWEGNPSCNHKPEKLKCNYDKFVDSHLKPYRCKLEACENARFSSTACLLRHEREAHAMHGHGDKPYLCNYEGCERSAPGNGFPRQWNLRDHMRRVHSDNGASIPAAASPPPSGSGSSKGRKRKKDGVSSSSSKSKSSSSTKSGRHSSSSAEVSTSSSKAAAAVAEAEASLSGFEISDWRGHWQALQTTIRDIGRPDDPRSLQQIKDAQAYLSAMGKISRETISTSKADVLRGGYRQSWSQSG